jgi:peptide/nickel transport system permease protein
MFRYVLKRLLYSLALLVILSMFVYIIFHFLPFDPARISCGQHCSPQTVAANRHRLGLDIPLWQQWWDFFRGLFVGRTYGDGTDIFTCPAPALGYSFPNNACVSSLIAQAFPVTLSLAVGSFILWMLLGISLGMAAARWRGTWIDRLANTFVLTASALPPFLVGILIYLWAFTNHLIDPINQGLWISPFSNPVGFFKNFIFAWITLALASAAIYTRLTRGNIIETSSEDFIRTARAKGVKERRILIKHNLRTSLAPLVSQAGLDFATLLGGAIFTEQIFQLPGLGRLAIKAVLQDFDLPVIVGTTLFAAAVIIVFNFFVDISYSIIDPRIRRK